MNTKEELIAIKNEVETVSEKIHKLNVEELEQVSGGVAHLDTNTDVGRSSMQKEIDASVQQIDDNSFLPFN